MSTVGRHAASIHPRVSIGSARWVNIGSAPTDILEGRLGPGEKLRIEALQERYTVGASPLREALNRLISVRLVEQVERRGFRVSPLSEDDLLDLNCARKLINEVVIRESLVHGNDAWEEQVVYAYHRMWRCPMTLPSGQANREWELLHRKFHEALVAACPTKWLRNFHELLFDCADRHRRLNVRRLEPAATLDEHRHIMEAAIHRDVARTVQLLNDAIDTLVASTPAIEPGVARPWPVAQHGEQVLR